MAQAGSASVLGTEGRPFESDCPDHLSGCYRCWLGPGFLPRITQVRFLSPVPDMKKEVYRSPPWNHNSGYTAYTIKYDDGSRKTTLEHREVMEEHLGRKLESEEHIHHIDENKKNNDLSNLVLTSRSAHAKGHATRAKEVEIICAWCGQKAYKKPNYLHHNAKQGKSGPFCGKSCSAKYTREVQLGRRERLPVQPEVPREKREYIKPG